MAEPAGGTSCYDDDKNEEAFSDPIRYTSSGSRVMDGYAGNIPDRPEYPRWDLPCPHCDRCWVKGWDEPNLPGSTVGNINGWVYRPNPYLAAQKQSGKDNAVKMLKQASTPLLKWMVENWPGILIDSSSRAGQISLDAYLPDYSFWEPYSMCRGYELDGSEFDLAFLPRFCRMIPEEVGKELLRMVFEKPFVSHEEILNVSFFRRDMQKLHSVDFSELKTVIDDLCIGLCRRSLAGVIPPGKKSLGHISPCIEELIDTYYQAGRHVELMAALLYVTESITGPLSSRWGKAVFYTFLSENEVAAEREEVLDPNSQSDLDEQFLAMLLDVANGRPTCDELAYIEEYGIGLESEAAQQERVDEGDTSLTRDPFFMDDHHPMESDMAELAQRIGVDLPDVTGQLDSLKDPYPQGMEYWETLHTIDPGMGD